MRRPGFEFGQRCERVGHWRRSEECDWVYGAVVAFSGDHVTVKTNLGQDMVVDQRRAKWKTSIGGWAIWAPWVMGVVLRIEEDERHADQIGVGRLRLQPLLGDFVKVHVRDSTPQSGFIVKVNGENVGIGFRAGDQRRRFAAKISDLHWDNDNDFWRIRMGSPQRNADA